MGAQRAVSLTPSGTPVGTPSATSLPPDSRIGGGCPASVISRLAEAGVDHDGADGREELLEARMREQEAVEAAQPRLRRDLRLDQRLPAGAQHGRHRGGLGPVAGDVADEQRDAAVGALGGRVEVSAELEALLARPVDGRDRDVDPAQARGRHQRADELAVQRRAPHRRRAAPGRAAGRRPRPRPARSRSRRRRAASRRRTGRAARRSRPRSRRRCRRSARPRGPPRRP